MIIKYHRLIKPYSIWPYNDKKSKKNNFLKSVFFLDY